MARSRRYTEDLTYAEAHRNELPHLYQRRGHRLDMADRDWTEFCHWCKEPLAVMEEVRDVGQDLYDKGTSVTRRIADRAAIPAFLFGWKSTRPPEVEARIAELGQELLRLYQQTSIEGFRARQLYPTTTRVEGLSPEQWWGLVLALHRDHHRFCANARRAGDAMTPQQLRNMQTFVDSHPLYDSLRLQIFDSMPILGART